jgi:signal transduction histidine kinase
MPYLPRYRYSLSFAVTVVTTSASRRHRLAHLVVRRRAASFSRRSSYVRAAALASLLLVCTFGRSTGWVVLLLLPALVALGLELRPRPGATGVTHLAWWTWSAPVLVAVPAWVLVDLPFVLRAWALASAMVVVVSVVTAVCIAPGWFDPERRSRAAAEWLRRAAGPLAAGGSAAIVVPADWPPDALPAVWALAVLPLVVGSRVGALDRTVRNAVPLIQHQGQLGRDQVLREIHGVLSTELRQLEQYARHHRTEAPALYERAVTANSSLRETLTLSDERRETSTTTDTLLAPVLTLIRAEGAAVDARIEVAWLHPSDREVARYVLNELVGNALRAGASRLQVTITDGRDTAAGSGPVPRPGPGTVMIEVTDDGDAFPVERWGRPGSGAARLRDLLSARDGVLTPPDHPSPPKTVRARWRAHP